MFTNTIQVFAKTKKKGGFLMSKDINRNKSQKEKAKKFMKMFLQLQPEYQEKIADVQLGMILAQNIEQKKAAAELFNS